MKMTGSTSRIDADRPGTGAGPQFHDVCFCIGSSWVQHCCVLMLSILDHTVEPARFRFHVFGHDLTDVEQEYLGEIAGRFGATVVVYPMDRTRFENLPIPPSSHFSMETYFRLLIPAILPETIEFVLYLDCDLLAVGDIAELFPLDWCRDAAIGAVPDSLVSPTHTASLGITQGSYVNTGVLVMNLPKLRRDRIFERAVEWLEGNRERARFLDQDALNVLLQGRIHDLPSTWNQLPDCAMPGALAPGDARAGGVCLVHFAGTRKPWHYRHRHPLKGLYHAYLEQTPYAGTVPTGRTPAQVFRKLRRTVAAFACQPRLLAWLLKPRALAREIRLNCGEW